MMTRTKHKFRLLMEHYPHKDILEEIYVDSCSDPRFDLERTIDDLFDHWMVKEGIVTIEELENQV
jgi:hypothetical protein